MSALRVSSILPWSTVFLWAISIVPTFAQLLPELRILPLGDSITKGSGSSDGNGFRDRLRKKILAHGTATGNRELSVDMVGTLRSGAMMDNQHEGHSGKFLEDIATYWQRPIAYRPNIVLIHAGTNNMDKNQNVAAAPDLIAGIIDGILQEAPDAVVLVAPVIFAKSPAMQERTNAFNEKLNSIISSRRRTGKHLMSVPIDIKTEDLNDDKHPNNAGYEKMAQAWWNAILDAHELGWIKSPVEGQVPENSGSSCPDGVWESKRVIFDDYRLWDDLGTFQVAANPHKQEKIIFADLNGDGRADYIVAEDDGTVYAKLNTKRPDTWWHIGQINPGWNSVTGNMIRMADVDNDGKADMIVLYSDGVARVWKNTYDWGKFNADTDTTGQTFFTALDSRWAAGLGEPRSNVRIIDMDGDGYADYVIVQSDGVVKWARNSQNNGKDQSKKNCEDVQTIAPGVAGTPAGSTYLYDLDGNGKAGKSISTLLIFILGESACSILSPTDYGLRLSHNLQWWSSEGLYEYRESQSRPSST
jgi:lysophospholipase L1-like esterase